ncbi:Sodium/glucose cotransporter 4 like protein [Argiope bruennichi]|uniref:Sodium/glucose cotransporter 4 like protein n=1 Tax=Argiope bruennichi TaxID=94029 RepID=A0A8T0DXJ7_ARGBR|nr:Sodium/glucose cotransporter 4 like protein [Argiope bruennichi]
MPTVVPDDSRFQVELSNAGSRLVVVDFTASWCGPCRRIAPFFDELSRRYPAITFLKVDVDQCPETATSQGVTSMPTFIFYKNKMKIGQVSGADSAALEAKIKELSGGEGDEGSESGVHGHVDLVNFISKSACECLNDADDHPFANSFTSGPGYLESDCDEQMMVQRLLAAKSLSHAQGGTLFAGFMKILPIFLIVMPGMISRVLYTDEVACVDPDICMEYCQNPAGCSNVAYPRLVLELMPSGLRGLMMAVMLAALMSDLTSVYNSASTLFTMDIWPQIRKKATVWELMIVGRTFIIIMIIVSIGWIPIIQKLQGGQLFIYIQSVSAYLAPPIAAVYILAVLWKRMNEPACFWAMMLGFVVGVTRMVLDFIYRQPGCNEPDLRPLIIQRVHYMYFACILFCITIISAVIISLITEPPEEYRLIRTTYWTRFDEGDRDDDKENFEMRRNVDLQEKVKLNDMSKEEAGAMVDEEIHEPAIIEEKTFLFYLRKLGNWFCGFNRSAKHKTNDEVFQHLTEVASLRQSRQEKLILNTLLMVALTVPVFTYIYFSIAVKKSL